MLGLSSFKATFQFAMITSVFFGAELVHAATLKQLVSGDDFAFAALTPEEQAAKPYYLLATKDGKQCRLPVVMSQEHLVKVSTKDCPFKDQLAMGQAVEMPLINEPILAKTAETERTPQGEKKTEGSFAVKREITDLQYQPYKGQSAVSLGVTSISQKEDISVAGSNYVSDEIKQQAGSLSYAYGVTDRLAVGISEKIIFNNEDETKYGPASGTSNGQSPTLRKDGWGDPEIDLLYRVLEQSKKSATNLDIKFGYLTKLQDAKAATTTDKGNAARGGDGFVGEINISRKMDGNSFNLSLGQTVFNKRTSDSGSTKVETSGGNLTQVGIAGQRQFTDDFAVDLGFVYTSVASGDQASSTVKMDIGSYNYTVVALGLKFVLVPDTAIVNLLYARRASYSSSATISGVRLDDNVTAADVYGLGVGFWF